MAVDYCEKCNYDSLKAEMKRLQGSVIRLEHIVAVLKTAIGQAHLSATHIEDHTRIQNGQLEVWCLGDWVDVEQANIEADEAAESERGNHQRWCNWQHHCREDVGNNAWTCTAHLIESRALQCPYKSMKDAKGRTYPCQDAEPVEVAEVGSEPSR